MSVKWTKINKTKRNQNAS